MPGQTWLIWLVLVASLWVGRAAATTCTVQFKFDGVATTTTYLISSSSGR